MLRWRIGTNWRNSWVILHRQGSWVVDITFGELAERWERAEGSTIKQLSRPPSLTIGTHCEHIFWRESIAKSWWSELEKLGKGEWVFRSRTGTPVNPGNALKRHVRLAAVELGISLAVGTIFVTSSRRSFADRGFIPKSCSDILGHKRVNLEWTSTPGPIYSGVNERFLPDASYPQNWISMRAHSATRRNRRRGNCAVA